MFTTLFKSAARIRELRDGRAGPLLEGFADELYRIRYARKTAREHIRAAEHFIYWTDRKAITVATLNDSFIDGFGRHLVHGCRCPGYRRSPWINLQNGARLFLRYLRDTGVVSSPVLPKMTEEPVLLTAFRQWMHQQRGISAVTLQNYSRPIRDLLKTVGDPLTFDALKLRRFVLERNKQSGWGRAKLCTAAVRAFLRFLIAEGKCPIGLDASIPGLAHWSLSSLPRYLQSEEVERVIASCDRATAVGRRDRAILLLLARMGLRAGDIVGLDLGDVDWWQAWIHVSGKGRRQTRLPMTQEVGDAIIAYLQDRRHSAFTEKLFLRSRAPFRALSSHCAVSSIVGRAMRRAAVKCASRGAAHVLRHSLASSMLNQGASLQEISVILRHRSTQTTEIYAKIDVNSLGMIVPALAGGETMLAKTVDIYLVLRRASGFSLKNQGSLLRTFARFSDAKDKHYVCSEIAIEWAGSVSSVFQRTRRLDEVIRFARYMHAEDPRHEIPPAVFGCETRRRPVPFIFSKDDIRSIVQTASQLGPPSLRRYTYSTLFALLSCTGLRISEAVRLRLGDITADGLVIRCSKFRKSRLVPLHETTRAALEVYLERRRPYAPFDDHLFVSLRRRRLLIQDAQCAFHTVVQKIGLPCGPELPRPTLHSLRHTFAVRALETCPDGRDRITKHMLALSTYLGHSKIDCTYWYLDVTPDLMRKIADACENFIKGGRP